MMTKELTDKPEVEATPGGTFFDPPLSVEELALQQGVKPFKFDELLALDERWPEDETVDDFIAAVREWRSEGNHRSLR
jgi:hypothetical protein